MVVEVQTRIILNELVRAGWTPKRRGKGSHSVWQCRTGKHSVTVPDGHRTMRPGVVRTVRAAIESCNC